VASQLGKPSINFQEFASLFGDSAPDFADRFEPSVNPDHDLKKFKQGLNRVEASPAISSRVPVMASAGSQHDGHGTAPEPPTLGSFGALQRVLRSKIEARARNIATTLRVALQRTASLGLRDPSHTALTDSGHGPDTSDRALPAEVYEVLGRFGLQISGADMALITRHFEHEGDGFIRLAGFIPWIMNDTHVDPSHHRIALGPQARDESQNSSVPLHDIPPGMAAQSSGMKRRLRVMPSAPHRLAASRHALPGHAFEAVMRQKLAQRHSNNQQWALRTWFNHYGHGRGARVDKLTYPQFHRLMEGFGVHVSKADFVRVLRRFDPQDSGCIKFTQFVDAIMR